MSAAPVQSRQKILFVCARNRIRSVTAERLFAGSAHYDVKSRGVANNARIKLTERDVRWADVIFVMEKNHKDRIAHLFPATVESKKIIPLFIEDIYEPMEPALIEQLRRKLASHLSLPLESAR